MQIRVIDLSFVLLVFFKYLLDYIPTDKMQSIIKTSNYKYRSELYPYRF